MRILGKWLSALVLVGTSFFTTTYLLDEPEYNSSSPAPISSFKSFYEEKLALSASLKARPENEERYVEFKEGKTPIAFLYIHGFGASRKEGEDVMDRLATTFQANTYYLRLPGHGTNVEDHLRTPFQEYLKAAEEALFASQLIGDKVILVGTSMGGLISTYLASKHPELVSGVILASPFYDFADPSSNLYHFTWGATFVDLVMGKIRKSKEQDPNDESYKFWYRDQYYASIKNLMNIKRYFLAEDRFSKVEDPVLMFYYYKSEEEQDRSASVPAMLSGFEKLKKAEKPSPLLKAVQVENGAHVLMSKYSPSDKELILKESIEFTEKVTGIPSSTVKRLKIAQSK